MDLALNLNYRSVAELEENMTVDEFDRWYLYKHGCLLPTRRIEYYLAQLTYQVTRLGQLWGGPVYNFKDFVFDEQANSKAKRQDEEEQDTAETGAEKIGAIVGGIKVIRLGQKRKHG